ncbi:hypothetical protein D3C83_91690 [compost metagenome]
MRVLRGRLWCRHVLEQQAGFAVDQEDVFDAEYNRVLEHHVGKRAAAAQGLQAPLQPAQ